MEKHRGPSRSEDHSVVLARRPVQQAGAEPVQRAPDQGLRVDRGAGRGHRPAHALAEHHRPPVLDAAGAETGMYEIPAGGRRFRALELLVKQKRLAKTAPIPPARGRAAGKTGNADRGRRRTRSEASRARFGMVIGPPLRPSRSRQPNPRRRKDSIRSGDKLPVSRDRMAVEARVSAAAEGSRATLLRRSPALHDDHSMKNEARTYLAFGRRMCHSSVRCGWRAWGC